MIIILGGRMDIHPLLCSNDAGFFFPLAQYNVDHVIWAMGYKFVKAIMRPLTILAQKAQLYDLIHWPRVKTCITHSLDKSTATARVQSSIQSRPCRRLCLSTRQLKLKSKLRLTGDGDRDRSLARALPSSLSSSQQQLLEVGTRV